MRYTNNYNLPQSLVDAITKNTYDVAQNNPSIISVTTLNNPPRIRLLSVRHWDKLTEDVSEGMWRLLGSAVHEVMARIDDTNRLLEERMFVDLATGEIITLKPKEKLKPVEGHIYISGRPDLYDTSRYMIEDYKITSVWAVKYDKEEWVNQINCYAWFYTKLGFPVKEAHINAILRDWSASQVEKSPDYPKIPFKTIPIKLWSFAEQDKYIKERAKYHNSHLETGDTELPVCTESERWKNDIRCKKYCSCKNFCSYYKEKYGKTKV
jgi:hypothetical protein